MRWCPKSFSVYKIQAVLFCLAWCSKTDEKRKPSVEEMREFY